MTLAIATVAVMAAASSGTAHVQLGSRPLVARPSAAVCTTNLAAVTTILRNKTSKLPSKIAAALRQPLGNSGVVGGFCRDLIGGAAPELLANVVLAPTGGAWLLLTPGANGWTFVYLGNDRSNQSRRSLSAKPGRRKGEVIERRGVFKPDDPNCCPSGGLVTRTLRWNGRTFVPLTATAPEARNLIATPTIKRQLRTALLARLSKYGLPTAGVRGPLKGTTYYGRYRDHEYAFAEFSIPPTGAQDQPETFSRRVGGRWVDRGDTGGEICPGRPIPLALIKVWHLRRGSGGCYFP